MVRSSNYSLAYKEVYEILKNMDEDIVRKIPKEFFDMLKSKMDNNYEFVIEKNVDFEEQKLLKETKVILAYIFLNYWATEKQRDQIMKIFNQDILEEQMQQTYNPDELFKNRNVRNKSTNTTQQEDVQMIEYKKTNILARIFGKIKNLFKKR